MEPSLNVNNNKYFGIFQENNNQDYFYFNDDVCIERKLEFNSASLNRTTSLYPLLLLHGSWRLTVKISTFLLADAITYAMRYTSTELELSEKLISTDFLSFFFYCSSINKQILPWLQSHMLLLTVTLARLKDI